MSMQCLTLKKTYSFMAAGGGGPGTGVGIVRVTTTEAGGTTGARHIFTGMCRPVGVVTIVIVAGEAMNGTAVPFPIVKRKRIGGDGKETGIGKNQITGVSGVWSADRPGSKKNTISEKTARPAESVPLPRIDREKVNGVEMTEDNSR